MTEFDVKGFNFYQNVLKITRFGSVYQSICWYFQKQYTISQLHFTLFPNIYLIDASQGDHGCYVL